MKTSWPAAQDQRLKMTSMCCLQFSLSLNNFQWKMCTGLHNSGNTVKASEVGSENNSLIIYEKAHSRQATFWLISLRFAFKNPTGAFSQILRKLCYLPTPAFTVFIPDFRITLPVFYTRLLNLLNQCSTSQIL